MNEIRKGLPILAFGDRKAFEDWLSAQGGSSDGLWLRLFKKGSGIATVSKPEAIDAALCHGWIDGQLDKYDAQSWLVRSTPRRPRSKWSEVNAKRAEELAAGGRMHPAGLAEMESAKADGRWGKTVTVYIYRPAERQRFRR